MCYACTLIAESVNSKIISILVWHCPHLFQFAGQLPGFGRAVRVSAAFVLDYGTEICFCDFYFLSALPSPLPDGLRAVCRPKSRLKRGCSNIL